jgi:hypothetical protein
MSSPAISPAIWQIQISLAEASITTSYVLIGTFTAPLEYGEIVSTLDAAVQISFDGVNPHIVAPAGSTSTSITPIPFKASNTNMPITSVFVKRIGTPTVGSIYVSGFSALIP